MNLISLIKPFCYMTKKQELKYLENEKTFWAEIISIFHRFYRAFNSQKLSQTWECAFKKTHDWTQTVVIQTLVIPKFLVWATYVYTVRRLKSMTLVFRVQSEHWVNFSNALLLWCLYCYLWMAVKVISWRGQ